MAQFEDYIQAKKQKTDREIFEEQQDFAFVQTNIYQDQREKGLGPNAGSDALTVDEVNEQLREKMEQSTFEERTQYYFEDQKYLESKVERYQTLAAAGDSELELHAEKYTNRSAKKRKSKAAAAAKSFQKARDIEKALEEDREKNGDSTVTPVQQYWNRNEIMRLRMDGMINAAKAKAISDKDEGCRIAKAKLSCLSILYDQAKTLRKDTEDEKEIKNFNTIEKNLLKEIASAQKDLKKNTITSTEKFKKDVGYDDPEVLKKLLDKSNNPNATMECAAFSAIMQQFSAERVRSEVKEAASHSMEVFGQKYNERCDEILAVTYVVKRDKNGEPVDKVEMKKDQWNRRWYQACSDPGMEFERKKMIIEATKRITDFPFPTPEELRKNGFMYYFKKDPAAYMQIMYQTLRIDNLKGYDSMVNEIYENDKAIKARWDAAKFIGSYLRTEMSAKYFINDQTGEIKADNNKMDKESLEENEEWLKGQFNDHLEEYTACYNRIAVKDEQRKKFEDQRKKEKGETYEHAKAEAEAEGNRAFDESSYKMMQQFKEGLQIMLCPQYMAAYDDIHKKLGSMLDISRTCSSVMRQVKFDENWEPVSKEDMENHEWNMKFLNNLYNYEIGPDLDVATQEMLKKEDEKAKEKEEGWEGSNHENLRIKKENSLKVMQDMIEEEYKKTYQGMPPLPAPEQLKKEIFEPVNNGQPLYSESMEKLLKDTGTLMPFMNKILNLEGPGKILPGIKEMVKEHPEWDAYADMCRVVMTMFMPMYVQTRYHIYANTGASTQAMVRQSQEFEPELAEAYLNDYEENYQKYQKLMNERKTG